MIEDNAIISRYLAGQVETCDILIERYKGPVYSFCCKLTRNRNEADDLFQDTWVKAMKNLRLYAPDKRFITWIFSICINLYRDKFRKTIRWMKIIKFYPDGDNKERDLVNLKSPDTGPEENIVKNENEMVIRRALAMLKDTFRLPIILFYYREFSIEEISGILGIPEGTVKSRLASGRNYLKEIVEDMDYERT